MFQIISLTLKLDENRPKIPLIQQKRNAGTSGTSGTKLFMGKKLTNFEKITKNIKSKSKKFNLKKIFVPDVPDGFGVFGSEFRFLKFVPDLSGTKNLSGTNHFLGTKVIPQIPVLVRKSSLRSGFLVKTAKSAITKIFLSKSYLEQTYFGQKPELK